MHLFGLTFVLFLLKLSAGNGFMDISLDENKKNRHQPRYIFEINFFSYHMQEKIILGRVERHHSSFLDKSAKGMHIVLRIQVSCHLRLPSKVFHKPLSKEHGCR